MNQRKTKPKHWTESPIARTIAWITSIIIMLLVAVPSALQALTDKAPKARTNKAEIINSELGIFEAELCNESSNPINWEEGIDTYTTRLKLSDYKGKSIPIHVNLPTISTDEKPACITLTGSIQSDFYGTGILYTECDGGIVAWCSDWKDPGKAVFRKNITHLIVDAGAQSFDDAKIGERYDSINPRILNNKLRKTTFTQAPGRATKIRDGLYNNPQKRPVICGNLTEEEKEFYTKIVRENFSQYINPPLFCTRDELLNPQDSNLSAFFWYIGDCDIPTENRGRICTQDSKLYTRRIHEDNPDTTVIFFPAISEEWKTE